MVSAVLVVSGVFSLVYGSLRGYAAARCALVPVVRGGDPTRTLIEASQPFHARARVRLAARNVLLAILWLSVAMYGLYLALVGVSMQP